MLETYKVEDRNELGKKIQDMAYKLGYEKCGIIKIEQMDGFEEKLNERIERVPMSKYFYDTQKQLVNIKNNYPWAKSIVVLATAFGKYKVPNEVKKHIGKAYLFEHRVHTSPFYKRSLDMEEYLKSLGLNTAIERKFGIVSLRWAALQANMGVIRKNNFFYTESGSWVHLEAFLIDEEIELLETTKVKKCPASCTSCIDSCPTKSLSEPYTMQPLTCVSFLTTFGGKDVPNIPLRNNFKECIYGCDICQDVCPMNKGKWKEEEEFENLSKISNLLSPENLLKMDDDTYRKKIQPQFFYLSPDELWKWKVNVLCYMENNISPEYKNLIIDSQNDKNPKVQEMAKKIYSNF